MKERVSSIIQEVFKEAENGDITINDWKFFVRFYTKVDGVNNAIEDTSYPVLEIRNYDSFIEILTSYLLVAEEFYKENKDYYELYEDDFYKRLIVDLLSGASSKDFNDINKYIELKTKMLLDENNIVGTHKIGELDDIEIYSSIAKNRSNCESPYRMDIYFKKGDEVFYLPSLNFAIVDDVCYLGSVQRKKQIVTNSLSKKLDRYFRKVNKGVDMEDIIANISPNALVSLTIFNALLRQKGIKEVKANAYMPIRYYGYKDKLIHKKDIDLEEGYKRLDLDQYNMTNKFMYLLLRYDYHFDCGSTFDDINDEMILNIDKTNINDNNIIYEIDELICKYNEKGRVNNGRVNKS